MRAALNRWIDELSLLQQHRLNLCQQLALTGGLVAKASLDINLWHVRPYGRLTLPTSHADGRRTQGKHRLATPRHIALTATVPEIAIGGAL